MQETQVRPLIQEDRTCGKAINPMRSNYSACVLKPRSRNYWKPACPRAHEPQREATARRSPQSNKDPAQPKVNEWLKKKKETKPQGTLILDFQPLELWEISFCCLSCPVYGILLQQPEPVTYSLLIEGNSIMEWNPQTHGKGRSNY